MNAETVRRSLQRLPLFMANLVSSMLFPPWSPRSPPSSEAEHQNEYALSGSLAVGPNNDRLPCRTQPPLPMRNRGRRNSHGRDDFYPGRPISYAVFFFNVNIFNFSREFFSSNLIFAPLLPLLLNYLQIHSSRTSMASVICTLAYYLALAAKFLFPGFASQFEALMTVFGSLALATLISLALHLPWWSIFFILLFMGGFFKLLNKLHATYGNIGRPQQRTMQPLLPLYNVIFNH